MENRQYQNVAIIGGGFCGIMTAINLAKTQDIYLHIHVINKGYPLAKGVAFNPHTSALLLNVPNGNMSAFPDRPEHFINWLNANFGHENEVGDIAPCGFSTREKYGQYLDELWQQALTSKQDNVRISTYDDFAVDIIESGNQFYVYLKNHPVLTADHVVLATGNDEPRAPQGISPGFAGSNRYFNNPWRKACVENLSPNEDVLIIGNGLTMADTVVGLIQSGLKGKIYTVSPHGYNLNPWVDNKEPYTGFDLKDLLKQPITLYGLVKAFNRHRKLAAQLGQSAYKLVDCVRPHVQQIWQSFSSAEKRRFIKYFSTRWGNLRHRLPNKMHRFIAEGYAEGRIQTFAGLVSEISEQHDHVEVSIGAVSVIATIRVQRVINCTGPAGGLKNSGNELLRKLHKNGLILQDELNLGVLADPEKGSVIGADGLPKPNLFVIGNNLKGMLWESTAVPELRVQAQKLAALLAEKAYRAQTQTQRVAGIIEKSFLIAS